VRHRYLDSEKKRRKKNTTKDQFIFYVPKIEAGEKLHLTLLVLTPPPEDEAAEPGGPAALAVRCLELCGPIINRCVANKNHDPQGGFYLMCARGVMSEDEPKNGGLAV
jgi:hypothetical protein